MDRPLIILLTRATRAGATFRLEHGRVQMTGQPGDDIVNELRTHRVAITALLAGNCANCDSPPWIHEHATAIPWCRPCAGRRGTALLRHEHPELLEGVQ